MTALTYGSDWNGHAFGTWPIRPPAPCGLCGQPGRPYLAGHRCDTHRPGGPPAATHPIDRPAAAGVSALEHAQRQWPGARRCAATDSRQQAVCPYPVDPANSDEAMHTWCEPGARRGLEAARLHVARQRSAAARAALAARGDAA